MEHVPSGSIAFLCVKCGVPKRFLLRPLALHLLHHSSANEVRGCSNLRRMLLASVAGCAFAASPKRTNQLTPRRGGALQDLMALRGGGASEQSVELPTVDDRVDGPLVQTLATVCAKLYASSLSSRLVLRLRESTTKAERTRQTDSTRMARELSSPDTTSSTRIPRKWSAASCMGAQRRSPRTGK